MATYNEYYQNLGNQLVQQGYDPRVVKGLIDYQVNYGLPRDAGSVSTFMPYIQQHLSKYIGQSQGVRDPNNENYKKLNAQAQELLGKFVGNEFNYQETPTPQSKPQEVAPATQSNATAEPSFSDLINKRTDELRNLTGKMYDQSIQSGTEDIRRSAIPIRQRAIADEAALGRLSSPVSIGTLSRADEGERNAMSDLIGKVRLQQAGSETDVGKTIANILANSDISKNTLSQQQNQFMQDLGLRRDTLNTSITESEKQRALQRELGQQQAAAMRDAYSRSGIQDASSIIGGLGTLAGGIASFYNPALGMGINTFSNSLAKTGGR